MNVAELERLAGGARPESMDCEEAITHLARRAIAAERMAEAARTVINSHWQEPHVRGIYNLERHLTAYEATK